MEPDNFDSKEEKKLKNKAKEMVSKLTEETKTDFNPRQEIADQKHEEGPHSKIPRVWDPQEVDFLVNNRKNLSNKEMKDFLEGESEFHKHKKELKDFSNTEEKFIRQNSPNLSKEEIANKLNKKEKVVSLKLKLMGLNPV